MTFNSIPQKLIDQGKRQPNAAGYFAKHDGVWEATSWRRYSEEVSQAGRALIALGFQPGQTVSILGFNRPEWVIMDLAAMGAGGAPAGIYTTCSASEVSYIIGHAESPVVLVENKTQWEKVRSERHKLPHLKHVVLMKDAESVDDPMVMTWEEFMAKGDAIPEQKYLERIASIKPGNLATLIYTSGTTGPPKGVMLSHMNLVWTAEAAAQLAGLQDGDCSLSYLPLSHIAEQMFSLHGPINMGYPIYFAESIDKVPDNLKEVQPTVFFGVPRIWEKFHAGITAKLADASPIKKKLVDWAMRVGRAANLRPNGHKGLQYRLAKKLIYSKLKPAIGLGRARFCVSGAAPIAREVLEFFASLDLVVLEVYGQSEDTGPTSFNQPDNYEFGSVGPIIPGIEVKLAEDDEILVRGPHVFMGYYKEPEATAQTLQNGWLHSGDLGKIEDGRLHIIGRKKEIIITAGGKNIAPKNIEAALKNHPLINEAVVIGDRRKYLTALVTIDPEVAAKRASELNTTIDELHKHKDIYAEVQAHMDIINAEFARVEQVKKFTILHRNFGVDTGELTPTLKVKRNRVNENFRDHIEAMYD